MDSKRGKLVPMVGLAVLAVAVFSVSAYQGKQAAAPQAQGMGPEHLTLEKIQAIMGKPGPRHSGAFDVTEAENEYFIVYHFYTTEVEDIDDDIGLAMAPKIRDLYAKIKRLDRVIFDVDVWREGFDPEWTSYCHFLMTRKTIEKSGWTAALDKGLLKMVPDLNYNEMMGAPKR
jgi:hypothetical protein